MQAFCFLTCRLDRSVMPHLLRIVSSALSFTLSQTTKTQYWLAQRSVLFDIDRTQSTSSPDGGRRGHKHFLPSHVYSGKIGLSE